MIIIRRIRYASLWLLILFFVTAGNGQRTGAEFLTLWPGARATALGGAFSAIADDATACHYNQAGLAFINAIAVSLQHCNWLPGLYSDMYYEYLGAAVPLKNGTLGIDVTYFTSGVTDVVDENGNLLGSYRAFDMAAGVHYGFKPSNRLGLGFGWKFIYSHLVAPWVWRDLPLLETPVGGRSASFAFDAGLIYRPVPILSLSYALQNMGPAVNYAPTCTSDPLPFTARLGIKSDIYRSKTIAAMASAEIVKILPGTFSDTTKTGHEQVNYALKEAWKAIGLELGYFEFLKIRAGYFIDSEGKRSGFTYGIGLSARKFALDWAADQSLYQFETANNKFSLSYFF